jgi:hypothetical protein
MPKEKHIPDDATRTSVCFTAEDRAAIRWISEVRRSKGDRRATINDIIVDSLWYYLETVEKKTREEIRVMTPPPVPAKEHPKNVTQMPKPKRKH